jgi:hypothetical protein
MSRTPSSLLIAPDFSRPNYIEITPQPAQWENLNFAAHQMNGGITWGTMIGTLIHWCPQQRS